VILEVDGIRIYLIRKGEGYYYSLTSILKAGYSNLRVADWLRTKQTIDMLFAWEAVHNENFNYGEFAAIRNWTVGPGSKNFRLGVADWIERTNAIGLVASRGRHGGTYAQKEIAIECAGWVNPLFKVEFIAKLDWYFNQKAMASHQEAMASYPEPMAPQQINP
jgi:hypothetical protein